MGAHTPLFLGQPPFSKIPPFLQIQDVLNFYINSAHKYLNFGRIFTKMVKCKLDIMTLDVFWSIL